MNWYKSESTNYPQEQDLTSSKKYNYVRRNIEQTERTDGEHEPITIYTYEECKIPKEAWDIYLELQQKSADIDYIAMETGVDLEV